ncbi:hypothetical protein B0T26DRAFT_724315 [Lasiosphaeria miniovina]|uniref:Uncharacterized protein n=1 Tax=Lasiosphaeria miniovina TaxID=1954250 RepID=A0AA40A6F8_9PEZI|nr:uncharacterized protein B0T26DRAFT_724315 [Lasiosphaeria miniovina]KAK0710198.1 hypothetical protein B0T26DRAFT_724315 [Lasiosphaeria miniovina]
MQGAEPQSQLTVQDAINNALRGATRSLPEKVGSTPGESILTSSRSPDALSPQGLRPIADSSTPRSRRPTKTSSWTIL